MIDADNADAVWDLDMTFDPRLSGKIRIRRGRHDVKARTFRILRDEGISDVVIDEPTQSGIVIYVNEIKG